MDIFLMDLDNLKEHEEVDLKHLKRLKDRIRRDNILKKPIAIDKNTKIIIDGHHRFNSLKQLGFSRIPSYLVDYNSPEILVKTRKNNKKITKEDVLFAGLNGKKLPPKTSKHMIKIRNKLRGISVIEKKVNVPLEKLRNEKTIIANNITNLIGRTPMIRINKLTNSNSATMYAKLEWFNIGGSVKDRVALYLLDHAELTGKLNKEKTILEATSGNTGIALSMIAAAKGYKISIVMPESVSMERRKIIKAYGAKLILSPGEKGTGGAIELKQKLLKGKPDKYVDINQFKDPANILAHYQTTGKEILEQTKGKLDMIVVGIGTAGTGVGISLRVKEYNPNIKVIGVTPKIGTKIQGLRNPKDSYPTQLFKKEHFDEIIEINEKEIPKIFETARKVARKEGLFIGMSAASIMYVALKKAKKLDKNKTIVAILPDSGIKYLSTNLFE